jgi:hypothetical protein
VDVSVDAQFDLVVASDGGMVKGLFDVHIIFKSNGWAYSYYIIRGVSKRKKGKDQMAIPPLILREVF